MSPNFGGAIAPACLQARAAVEHAKEMAQQAVDAGAAHASAAAAYAQSDEAKAALAQARDAAMSKAAVGRAPEGSRLCGGGRRQTRASRSFLDRRPVSITSLYRHWGDVRMLELPESLKPALLLRAMSFEAERTGGEQAEDCGGRTP